MREGKGVLHLLALGEKKFFELLKLGSGHRFATGAEFSGNESLDLDDSSF